MGTAWFCPRMRFRKIKTVNLPIVLISTPAVSKERGKFNKCNKYVGLPSA